MKKQKHTGIGRRLKAFMLKHVPGMITCREFDAFITAYLDGELPARARARFDMHLRLCRECRQYLIAYQQTIAVGRAAFAATDEPLPDDVPEALIKAILELRQEENTDD